MRQFALALALTLVTSFGFAKSDGFTGDWVGKGTYVLNGRLTQCSSFQLVFLADSQKFEFVSGGRTCDEHSEKFVPIHLDLKNGSAFYNGQNVGTYSDNKMDLSFRMPAGDTVTQWRMSMHRQGDHLVYEESLTTEGQVSPTISFAGLVLRKK